MSIQGEVSEIVLLSESQIKFTDGLVSATTRPVPYEEDYVAWDVSVWIKRGNEWVLGFTEAFDPTISHVNYYWDFEPEEYSEEKCEDELNKLVKGSTVKKITINRKWCDHEMKNLLDYYWWDKESHIELKLELENHTLLFCYVTSDMRDRDPFLKMDTMFDLKLIPAAASN